MPGPCTVDPLTHDFVATHFTASQDGTVYEQPELHRLLQGQIPQGHDQTLAIEGTLGAIEISQKTLAECHYTCSLKRISSQKRMDN